MPLQGVPDLSAFRRALTATATRREQKHARREQKDAGHVASQKPDFTRDGARVDDASIAPLPNSEKIYLTGSRPDIRVPMRKITQSDTPTDMGGEVNLPVYVYDTSGPYTDPQAEIDIRNGLAPLPEARADDHRAQLPARKPRSTPTSATRRSPRPSPRRSRRWPGRRAGAATP